MGCTLFVTNKDVAYIILLKQRIVDMQHRSTGVTEYVLHTLFMQ